MEVTVGETRTNHLDGKARDRRVSPIRLNRVPFCIHGRTCRKNSGSENTQLFGPRRG